MPGVHGANMGPIWDRQGPGGPHIGPMNFAIWDIMLLFHTLKTALQLQNSMAKYRFTRDYFV